MRAANDAGSAFARRQAAPWERIHGLQHVLVRWAGDPKIQRNIVLDEVLPARESDCVPMPEGLAAPVRGALTKRGIHELYRHQAAAFEMAQAGQDVVVATPTASGKSLCYNLPVLNTLSAKPEARALYLFPTKALARDQEEALRGLLTDAGLDHGAITYDGDTPPDARRSARGRSGVLITNPDMLHTGVLPHHAQWARFFARLEYVVVDELHSYRGVFGSHLSNVLRRLDRVARFHGATPRFLFSSATIGNPAEHATRLSGRTVNLVDKSGAPTGRRRVMVYNPPVINPELGLRQSTVKCAVRLTVDLVRAQVPTLVFGQSRNQVEVMLKYLRDRLKDDRIDPEAIQGYRGGYLPETRRRIERGLRDGQIACVVATNALELGIDIGSLDAVVCAGYPGTMAGTWQRFGRSGRRSGDALSLLVTSSAPLDQYLARSPKMLMEAPIEQARVDPDNVEILVQHLKCAAFELPFEDGEAFGDVDSAPVTDALHFLADHRVVQPVPGRNGKTVFHWSTDAYPAHNVSLRSPTWENFVIIDVERTKTIAEMDFRSTHTMLHEQAIYQHEGEQFQVERLDYENHKAFVRKVAPDYYTTAMTKVKVAVLEEDQKDKLALGGGYDLQAGAGDVEVTEKVVGFKKIKFHTHENVGYGEVNLPAVEKATTAFWLIVPEPLIQSLSAPRAVVMDALRGLLSAMHAVASVGLMMDPMDVGKTVVDERGVGQGPTRDGAPGAEHGQAQFEPTLYLYDTVAGGIGLAPRLFEEREALLARAQRLIAGCRCQEGCPSCVGPVTPQDDAAFSRKAVALDLLAGIGLGA